jgi:PilZ domain-containing protein
LHKKPNTSPEDGVLSGKRIHLALPVRWSLAGQEGRGASEMACTYDIHPNGARLLGGREVNVGDLVVVERGRNKAVCQVIWAADPDSALRGQFSVQCVENKTPWDEELRQMEEQYQPVILDGRRNYALIRGFSRPNANRRRRPRFEVEGQAEVIEGVQHLSAELHEISECGARIAATELMRPGTDFRLTLNVLDVSLALKAQVKYMVGNLGMGVEFQKIRRGDRPLLSYVLSQLRNNRLEDFVPVEVVTEPRAAAVGF